MAASNPVIARESNTRLVDRGPGATEFVIGKKRKFVYWHAKKGDTVMGS